MVAAYREYFLQDLHFNDRVAQELLDRLGLPRPTLFAHVFPTLSEVHRSLGDVYLLQRTTPRLRKFLSPIFAWLRRGIRSEGEGPWLSLTPMD